MTMRKRTLNNRELEALGKKLFGAAKLSESEIDRIASAPELFDGVLERTAARSENRSASGSFKRVLLGSGAAAILFAGFFTILLQQNSGRSVLQSSLNTPVEGPDAARPELTPQVRFVKGFTQGRAEILADVTESPVIENAIQREHRRPSPRPQLASYSEPAEQPEFVAVTYTGDGGESARDGRVVRVDIPRSTLFAMGFNVSLENASPTVKADLLIGPDGVTRAIRLVE